MSDRKDYQTRETEKWLALNSWDNIVARDEAEQTGMPAAATFGESIILAQMQVARMMKNPDQYRKRAMYRAISKLISEGMDN